MSTAKIKIKNLPPAPPPTKACKVGNSFHQIPGKRDLANPDKQVKAENVIYFEVRDEDDPTIGLTITTNKYHYSRAIKATLDAFDTWLNVWDVTASYYFREDDIPMLEESTLLEVACNLFKTLGIGGHIEGKVDIIDPSAIYDIFWVSKRENHLERRNKRKIPTFNHIDTKWDNAE